LVWSLPIQHTSASASGIDMPMIPARTAPIALSGAGFGESGADGTCTVLVVDTVLDIIRDVGTATTAEKDEKLSVF
jgi:hypothetical protein